YLTLAAAWCLQQNREANREISQAKLYASEMLARVTDSAIQIFGGMGLMDELPLERLWRDARVERIWDGTSEIQRHIISRELLRPLGAGAGVGRTASRDASRPSAGGGARPAEGQRNRCCHQPRHGRGVRRLSR